jgi:hypothetical protein
MKRVLVALKALRQLGPRQVGLYGLYKFGLMTGHYRRLTSPARLAPPVSNPPDALQPIFTLPSPADLQAVLGVEGHAALLAEAEEIVGGRVRLFGAEPVPLSLTVSGNLAHWTDYERGHLPLPLEAIPHGDIKYIWEPARFGWAFTLGRAFHLGGDERHAEAFWQAFETFTVANPPGMGPHWMSAQEVALRLMAFVWAGQVFEPARASSPERKRRLAEAVAAHAARIPPTLPYARSQHNNHLLTEAAGLLTAGLALPAHPQAERWRALGWRWLNRGLQSQIDSYGEYSQHSTNYHRLMLQVALWVNALLPVAHMAWPVPTREALTRAVHWMLSLLDYDSGAAPNLGANDGASIFPLSGLPFADQRPVLHAAARLFLRYDLPSGAWDELALWFGAKQAAPGALSLPRYLGDQLYSTHSWASLRTAQYTSRPSHADQLHFDLWWRGLNIAQDPGTYLYNAAPPWENPLVTAFVHNTVTVNGRDQMRRAGRFLYLDWVNAYRRLMPVSEPAEVQRLRGRYRGQGYRHTRLVSVQEGDRWRILDEVLSLRPPWQAKALSARLHWLLPDWEYELAPQSAGCTLRLHSPHGWVSLEVAWLSPPTGQACQVSLVRAGETLFGTPLPDPVRGWTSPTYGVKLPALSLALSVENSPAEIVLSSTFTFPQLTDEG